MTVYFHVDKKITSSIMSFENMFAYVEVLVSYEKWLSIHREARISPWFSRKLEAPDFYRALYF